MNVPPPTQPTPAPHADVPPSPQKKRPSGCVLALLALGGLVLLGGLVVAVIVVRFMTSSDGKKVVAAVGAGMKELEEASQGPGTNELRAIGCTQAMVMDNTKIDAIARTIGDAGVGVVNAPTDVNCGPSPSGPIPTCDQVAATYLAAVGGRARGTWFQVSVSARQGRGCRSRYTPDGKPLPASHQ